MKVTLACAVTVGTFLALAPMAGAQVPAAREWKSALTAPTSGASTTIRMSRSSRAGVKVGTGAVTFYVKVAGIVDVVTSAPVTLAGNTFEVQVLVNGMTRTAAFSINIVNGKTSPTTVKFPVALTDTAIWGSVVAPGQPIEVRRVRLIEVGTGDDFAVAGVTAR